jgi:hypothetical protein
MLHWSGLSGLGPDSHAQLDSGLINRIGDVDETVVDAICVHVEDLG